MTEHEQRFGHGGAVGEISVGVGHVVLQPSSNDAVAGAGSAPLSDLYRLSDPTLSELHLDAFLDEVLIRIRDILKVDTVAILLLDPETNEVVARAAKGLEAEVEQGVRVPLGRGFAGRVAFHRAPIFIPDLEHAEVVNPILREIGIESLLGVPLVVEGQLVGVLHVGSLTPRTFTAADAALLGIAAGRIAPGIERARLFDALEEEHRAATALQRSLLPDTVPEFVDVDVAVRYQPARDEVGGDWYDVVPLPHHEIGIVIGDVVGHGVRAAALMAQLRTGLRAYALDGHPPAAVLERLDRLMQLTHPGSMATVIFAVLDSATWTLKLATAGHLPPVIAGPRSSRVLEVRPAPPLGTRSYPTYEDVDVPLATGETVLLYTDGLVEVRGESLDIGIERLRVAAAGDTNPEQLCARVMAALQSTVSGDDDLAMVALSRLEPPEELIVHLPAEPLALAPMRRRLRAWLRHAGADEDELTAIVLAVGEASANAIEHAYPPVPSGFEVRASLDRDTVQVVISDGGRWREARGEQRGRGLGIMRDTMDDVEVRRTEKGTEVVLRRRLGQAA